MVPSGLVLVRVTVGAIVAARGWRALRAGVDASLIENARETIERAPALYAWFGKTVVLGFPTFSAHVAVWGQLLLGLLLLMGALVRPAGILLALLVLNGCFAGPDALRTHYLLIAMCAVACAWARAGRRGGMDSFLDQSLPSWLTWASSSRRRPF